MSLRIHAAAAVGLTLTALACGPAVESAPPAAPDVYDVRAEVVQLPRAPGGDLRLHHESIPDFRNSTGDAVGMAAMSMPFTPGEGLDVSGLAVGDRVEVTFEVYWEPKPALLLTRVDALPQGTRLEFDAAEPEPPAAAPPGDEAGDSPDASR